MISFEDGVKGKIEFKAEDILDDFVIARSDGSVTYNFCVVIDNALMKVSDVIRGNVIFQIPLNKSWFMRHLALKFLIFSMWR